MPAWQQGRRAAALALAWVAIMLAPDPAPAHPHVWAKVKTEILFGPDHRVSGFRQAWTFDEYYSAFASQGLDKNGDGKFDRQELDVLAEENVASLKEYDYFTFVRIDGDKAQLLEPRDYWMEQADGLLTLNFTLPLKEPVDARLGVVSVAIYDPTYYVDFAFVDEQPVRLAAAAPKECKPVLGRESKQADAGETKLSEAFFEALGPGTDFGSQFAQSAVIDCRGH